MSNEDSDVIYIMYNSRNMKSKLERYHSNAAVLPLCIMDNSQLREKHAICNLDSSHDGNQNYREELEYDIFVQ